MAHLKCDGVFEGGGVKGIGFAGAVSELEKAGYEFENVVGTSAGAIAAALVAAGYTGKEIETELKSVSFKDFRQKNRLHSLGTFGKIISVYASYGIYKTDNFERWLQELLHKKNKRFFEDIKTGYTDKKYKYKFQAIASDLTDGTILVLPSDLAKFGIDPDKFEIAKAVRMSMSIPLYYEPYRLKDKTGNEHLIVDGGLLSNYPVWILDNGTSNPPWPTFGFRFIGDDDNHSSAPKVINNFIEYSKHLVSTMIEYGDKYHISESKGDLQRSILIPTQIQTKNGIKKIKTTYFDISPEESALLAQNGKQAASQFLKTWDFKNWKMKYRSAKNFI